jgi:hypothetical protein
MFREVIPPRRRGEAMHYCHGAKIDESVGHDSGFYRVESSMRFIERGKVVQEETAHLEY